jgi:carbonic anhydrase
MTRVTNLPRAKTRAPGRAAVIALSMLVLAACGGPGSATPRAPTGPPAWNHDPADASLGPESWGSIDPSFEACRDSSEQSPIDIVDPVAGDLPPLVFDYSATALVVENTGHVIEVPTPDDAEQTLTIGEDVYRLVQYHFHAPSEHTVDGVSYDVEAHLVHQDEEGALAVVGVFLDRDATPSNLLDAILANAPDDLGDEVDVDEDRSPFELLPVEGSSAQVTRYATYAGSLTTPGCTEGVRWIVLNDTIGASSAAVDRLHELIADFPGYDGYGNNNRPTQPLNDRQIQTSD